MITIYQAEGDSEYLPFNLIGVAVEDCREWTFTYDSMRLLALSLLSALIPIVQIVVVAGVILW